MREIIFKYRFLVLEGALVSQWDKCWLGVESSPCPLAVVVGTVNVLNIGTGRSEQTVQTKIRLLLKDALLHYKTKMKLLPF